MTHAIKVSFDRRIPPYSDEEGLVPGRVEDVGLTRRATLVSPDRRTIYVLVEESEVSRETLTALEERLTDGFEPYKGPIYWDAPPGFPFIWGPTGQSIPGVVLVHHVELEGTAQLYHSAALAERAEEEAGEA